MKPEISSGLPRNKLDTRVITPGVSILMEFKLKHLRCNGRGGGGWGAGIFLNEHMPKSTQRVGGCIS